MLRQANTKRLNNLLPVRMNTGAMHDDDSAAFVFLGLGINTQKLAGAVIEPDSITIENGINDLIGPAFFLCQIGSMCCKREYSQCDDK